MRETETKSERERERRKEREGKREREGALMANGPVAIGGNGAPARTLARRRVQSVAAPSQSHSRLVDVVSPKVTFKVNSSTNFFLSRPEIFISFEEELFRW